MCSKCSFHWLLSSISIKELIQLFPVMSFKCFFKHSHLLINHCSLRKTHCIRKVWKGKQTFSEIFRNQLINFSQLNNEPSKLKPGLMLKSKTVMLNVVICVSRIEKQNLEIMLIQQRLFRGAAHQTCYIN